MSSEVSFLAIYVRAKKYTSFKYRILPGFFESFSSLRNFLGDKTRICMLPKKKVPGEFMGFHLQCYC